MNTKLPLTNHRRATRLIGESSIIAFPMHGQTKLSKEGYRTRDGHLIEWFGQLLPPGRGVAVVSRPEPLPLYVRDKRFRKQRAQNTSDVATATVRFPPIKHKRKWWMTSVPDYPRSAMLTNLPAVAWNPFVATHPLHPKRRGKFHFDILDDWTQHFAFARMNTDVERAYAATFETATSVTANSEATVELAHRFGRSDVELLTNGCDPERFTVENRATGPLTVGYVGKIGKRLDLNLIIQTCKLLPEIQFVFAGPFLDREYQQPMSQLENIRLLGDVHYSQVPDLLTTFDIGWVPHRLGEGEVGGDVIKTYEYRAAGLPVLTTPVLGAGDRGLAEVYVLDGNEHKTQLGFWLQHGPRVERVLEAIPARHTWAEKAAHIMELVG